MKTQKQILKKHFGQNFLVDDEIIEAMVEVAETSKDDVVIEVGAGTGNLTRAIAEKAGRVIAVEIDKNLMSMLERNLRGFDNVEIVNQDILEVDFDKWVECRRQKVERDFSLPTTYYVLPTTILGSIPYSITSPLIHKILFSDLVLKSIVFLIQWEVAEKICSQPPKASYLSNLVASCGEAEIIQKVSSSAFQPQPKVDSAIIKIKKFGSADREFSDFLHQGFVHPRKMMRKKFDESLLKKLGIDPEARAQELKLHEWEKLFNFYLKTQMSKVKATT